MNIESLRDQIPAIKNQTYLMAAAASPLHPVVYQRSIHFQKELFELGDINWEEHLKEVEDCRKRAAKFVNAKPEEIAFLGSTSSAMNMFALTIKNRCQSTGESLPRVLTMEDEFPSSTIAWIKHGYQLDFVKSNKGVISVEAVEKSIKPGTGILLLSQVQYSTGFKQSLPKILDLKRRKGLITVLNATQALGAEVLDAKEFDFVCASLHKWMMSGLGLSLTKISKKYLSELPLAGWLSQNDFFSMRNNVLDEIYEAKALELGCGPYLQILSLGAYLKWLEENGGVEAISRRIRILVDAARERFRRADVVLLYDFEPQFQSGILMVQSKNAEQCERRLAARRIYVSARGKGIRVALHYFNDVSDIDTFVQNFQEVEKKL